MGMSGKWLAAEKDVKQPDLFSAAAERERNVSAVVQRAECAEPGFQARATAFVCAYLRHHSAAAGEDITDACRAAGICPPDDRAFGAVYQGLVRAGLIAKCGSAPRRKGHATSGGNVWRMKK